MTNKKQNAKRLCIYLVIVFAASALLIIFREPMRKSQTAFFIIQQLFCLSPAIASVITRAVTKEGFRDMKLHLRLRGNFRYYLLAFALPLVFVPAFMIIPAAIRGNTEWPDSVKASDIIAAVFQLVTMAVFGSVGLIGEELGWRGYMNRKTEPLFGRFEALFTCLIGGLIWGLWHFPIDIANYMLGFETASEMFQNAIERTVILIMLSVILMWLTKKTDSIFPAVILHAVYNGTVSVVDGMLSSSGSAAELGFENVIGYLPLLALAVMFMIFMLKSDKKSVKTQA